MELPLHFRRKCSRWWRHSHLRHPNWNPHTRTGMVTSSKSTTRKAASTLITPMTTETITIIQEGSIKMLTKSGLTGGVNGKSKIIILQFNKNWKVKKFNDSRVKILHFSRIRMWRRLHSTAAMMWNHLSGIGKSKEQSRRVQAGWAQLTPWMAAWCWPLPNLNWALKWLMKVWLWYKVHRYWLHRGRTGNWAGKINLRARRLGTAWPTWWIAIFRRKARIEDGIDNKKMTIPLKMLECLSWTNLAAGHHPWTRMIMRNRLSNLADDRIHRGGTGNSIANRSNPNHYNRIVGSKRRAVFQRSMTTIKRSEEQKLKEKKEMSFSVTNREMPWRNLPAVEVPGELIRISRRNYMGIEDHLRRGGRESWAGSQGREVSVLMKMPIR